MHAHSIGDVLALLKPGFTVYVPGMSGESLVFWDALKAHPELAAGVRFVGVHFPGINRSNYLALHPTARQRSYFMLSGLRAGFVDGRAELIPVDYPGAFRDLSRLDIDVALVQVSTADERGRCSLGVSYDFLPAVWSRARLKLGHINPRLPRTRGSFSLPSGGFDASFESEADPLHFDAGAADPAIQGHARRVAELVRDGDTLQFGVGRLQSGVLSALTGHRHLRVYSGMVSTPITALIDAGVIAGDDSIEAGVALGDASFYKRIGEDRSFYFRSVDETHDVCRIASIQNFCAINSAVEVDLFGQVNADRAKGRLLAGVGGMPAFAAGARRSVGGRSIIALPATTEDGLVSRIVPALSANGLTALPRCEADFVVTEHGIAALRGLSVHARARALIAVAAPRFQHSLSTAWHETARRF